MEITKSVGVHFGVLCDPLDKQLKDQGLKYDPKEVEHFEMDMEALDRLRIRGLLTDSTADKVREKLHKKIVSHVAKCEKLKVKRPIYKPQ